MKPNRMIAMMAAALLFTGIVKAQQDPLERGLNAITKEAIKGQLDFLASDWMEGRETSTKGEFMAGDFISALFQIYGVQPAGEMAAGNVFSMDQAYLFMSGNRPKMAPPARSYFQNIPFIQTLKSESSMELITKKGNIERKFLLSKGIDYSVWGSGSGQEITAPIVFIGYGYKNDSIGYDDFKGIDVKGKIVLRISGLPGMRDTLSLAWKNLKDRNVINQSWEIKDRLLREYQAAGVIDYPGYNMGNPVNYPFRYNTRIYEGEKSLNSNSLNISLPIDTLTASVLNITLAPKVVTEIMNGAGIDIKEFEINAAAKLKPASREIIGKTIHLTSSTTDQVVRGRNVLAMIEGENPNEVIVIGAHYDHLGTYNGYIWNGSDDNASGTVGVLTLAKAFMATGIKPKKTIIFAAWTAEEKGLLGSEFFARHSRLVPGGISLVINLDMISGSAPEDTARQVISIGTLPVNEVLRKLAGKDNAQLEHPFTLDLWDVTGHSGSDYGPFASRKIPVMTFFSGFTDDYHTPRDVAGKSDPGKMEKILKIVNSLIGETCVNPPDR